MAGTAAERSELAGIVARARSAVIGVVLMSAVLNVLTLGGSIYMMLVYDLILPSRSASSLFGLLIMVTVIYVFQAIIDYIRGRVLTNIGAALDMGVSGRIYTLISRGAIRAQGTGAALQPMRDIDTIRGFLSSSGPGAIIDLPWVVFFIAVLSIFHIWLGVTALVGAAIMIALTWITDRLSREPATDAAAFASARAGAADAGRRHAEVIQALGMRGRREAAWSLASGRHLAAQQRLADVSGGFGGASRVFRMLLQSLVLTVGALLVIDNKASGGVIFASSILAARALAPIDQTISNWKNFIAARQGWDRLNAALAQAPEAREPLPLPAPEAELSVENLTLAPPGSQRPTVIDATFRLVAGDAVSVIGASASGKSSLARGLVGVWPPAGGKVRLDGGALDQWAPDALGRHVGYLPQNVELIEGSVADNIARFDPEAAPEAIIAAAKQAGVHELIVRLPQGYETQVGLDGMALSAGQRQRIALARALYGDPFFVVLDEPNSNLDADGEAALIEAIGAVRKRGGIVVVVAHRPGVLDAVDLVLFLHEGRIRGFGPKSEILPRVLAPPPPKVAAPKAEAAE